MLSIYLNSLNLSVLSALVKTTATCNSVLWYFNSNFSLLTWYFKKLNLVSMCLLFPCVIGFLAKLIYDLLLWISELVVTMRRISLESDLVSWAWCDMPHLHLSFFISKMSLFITIVTLSVPVIKLFLASLASVLTPLPSILRFSYIHHISWSLLVLAKPALLSCFIDPLFKGLKRTLNFFNLQCSQPQCGQIEESRSWEKFLPYLVTRECLSTVLHWTLDGFNSVEVVS